MTPQEIAQHKMFPKAKRLIEFLLDRYQAGEHTHVQTADLQKQAGTRSLAEWKKVHEIARDLLALRGLDLVNEWGGGYAIAHAPQQTVREIVKSLLRGFGHIGSAEMRREQFDAELAKLPKEGARIWGQVEGTLGGMKAFTETSRKQLQEAMHKLDGLENVEAEVSNVPDRLYEEEQQRKAPEAPAPKDRAEAVRDLRAWLATISP